MHTNFEFEAPLILLKCDYVWAVRVHLSLQLYRRVDIDMRAPIAQPVVHFRQHVHLHASIVVAIACKPAVVV